MIYVIRVSCVQMQGQGFVCPLWMSYKFILSIQFFGPAMVVMQTFSVLSCGGKGAGVFSSVVLEKDARVGFPFELVAKLNHACQPNAKIVKEADGWQVTLSTTICFFFHAREG